MKRHPFRSNGSEFADSAVSNVVVADCISGRKAINIGQKIAEKEPLGLQYNTADPFPHNYTLYTRNYMCLLAPHENKHPSKISTHSDC